MLPLEDCEDENGLIEIASKIKLLESGGGISSAMSSGSYMSNSRMSVVSESDPGDESMIQEAKEEIFRKETEYANKQRRMSLEISQAREVIEKLDEEL